MLVRLSYDALVVRHGANTAAWWHNMVTINIS